MNRRKLNFKLTRQIQKRHKKRQRTQQQLRQKSQLAKKVLYQWLQSTPRPQQWNRLHLLRMSLQLKKCRMPKRPQMMSRQSFLMACKFAAIKAINLRRILMPSSKSYKRNKRKTILKSLPTQMTPRIQVIKMELNNQLNLQWTTYRSQIHLLIKSHKLKKINQRSSTIFSERRVLILKFQSNKLKIYRKYQKILESQSNKTWTKQFKKPTK